MHTDVTIMLKTSCQEKRFPVHSDGKKPSKDPPITISGIETDNCLILCPCRQANQCAKGIRWLRDNRNEARIQGAAVVRASSLHPSSSERSTSRSGAALCTGRRPCVGDGERPCSVALDDASPAYGRPESVTSLPLAHTGPPPTTAACIITVVGRPLGGQSSPTQ